MRLTEPNAKPDAAIADRLDVRLRHRSSAPVAVGFSGGGDSLALLLSADAWARRCKRELLVLTVDHGLQARSAQWTAECEGLARRLGQRFHALSWTGPKPATGLPAAARRARHRLLADAARAAGASVILLGHTADDVAEAEAMRAAGSTTPSPREWAPSPLWPEGRGLFLLRPMLALRRAALRDWLASRGETWIDDPANDNLAYARARARTALSGAGPAAAASSRAAAQVAAQLATLAAQVRAEPWGGLTLDRRALRDGPADAIRAVVGAACLSAAGTARPPRSDRLDRLVEKLRSEAPVTATLCGARVQADSAAAMFMREAGELVRTGAGPQALPPGAGLVWDGRFELNATRPGLVVQPLAGSMARLDPAQRRALAAVPAAARGGLPLILGAAEEPLCPLLKPVAGLSLQGLAAERLAAACGLIEGEP